MVSNMGVVSVPLASVPIPDELSNAMRAIAETVRERQYKLRINSRIDLQVESRQRL